MSINDNFGCSVCKNPGQEKYETYIDYRDIKRCQYDFRDYDGELFSTVKKTLEECRRARNEWLNEKYDGIIASLAMFLRGDTLDDCPIFVTSREEIEGEDAEIVRFVFGDSRESCIAIRYNGDIIFTPMDWQNPVWDEEGWKIEDTQWMDCRFKEGIMLNGLPRLPFL